ncbi:MAG: XdhC family protein [Nitratireductor sp.]|nr:XdhC family protein [Nitratireductor sp.]
MELAKLTQLNEERRARRAVILLTDLGDGSSRIVREGEKLDGELGEAVAKAFRSGKSGTIEADGRTLFMNVHVPPARIVVIGAVHISQALAPMARIAGFDLEIIDPRAAFATPERFAGVGLYAEWPEEVLRDRPLDRYTALAALTHDPKIDDFPLTAALQAGCFYVGALGSRKTNARRRERLVAGGLSEAQFDRIAAPIGLDIGASSPAEIAVAILAQIIAALRQRDLSGALPGGAMAEA